MAQKTGWFATTMLGVLTLALNGLAAPPTNGTPPTTPVKPGSLPIDSIAPVAGGVRIAGFRLVTPPTPAAPYTGGPLDVEVLLENKDRAPAQAITVKLGTGALEQVVSIPPGGTRYVKFTDPSGLVSSCSPKTYTIDIAGQGAVAGTHKGTITPTCTFKSSVVDPWNLAAPDRVLDWQKGRVFVENATLEAAPSCNAGPKLKARIVNNSKTASPSLTVQLKANDVVKAQTSAAFPLAAGELKTILLTPVAGPLDVTDKLDVFINDWTKSLGAQVANQGIRVNTTRTCSLGVAFE